MYRLKYFPRDRLPLRRAMEFRSTSIASKLCRSQQDRQSLAVHRQLLKKKEDKPCDVGRSHSDVFLWCSVRLLFRVQVDAHQWHSFWFLRWSDSSLPFLLLHRTVVRTFVCDTSASSAKRKMRKANKNTETVVFLSRYEPIEEIPVRTHQPVFFNDPPESQ